MDDRPHGRVAWKWRIRTRPASSAPGATCAASPTSHSWSTTAFVLMMTESASRASVQITAPAAMARFCPSRAVAETTAAGSQILVVSRATGEVLPLVPGGTHPRYAASGHIVYASEDGGLSAVGFDAARLAVTGAPVLLVEASA